MKLRSRFTIALVVVAYLTAWFAPLQGAELKAINIGWTGGSAWTALPDRIASERGFFEKEGLRVRYIQFQGTNLMLSALQTAGSFIVQVVSQSPHRYRFPAFSSCSRRTNDDEQNGQ